MFSGSELRDDKSRRISIRITELKIRAVGRRLFFFCLPLIMLTMCVDSLAAIDLRLSLRVSVHTQEVS